MRVAVDGKLKLARKVRYAAGLLNITDKQKFLSCGDHLLPLGFVVVSNCCVMKCLFISGNESTVVVSLLLLQLIFLNFCKTSKKGEIKYHVL